MGNRARRLLLLLPLHLLRGPLRPLPRVQILISTIFAVFLPPSLQSPRNPFLRMVLCPSGRLAVVLTLSPDFRWVSSPPVHVLSLDGPQFRKLLAVQFPSQLAMIFNLTGSSPRYFTKGGSVIMIGSPFKLISPYFQDTGCHISLPFVLPSRSPLLCDQEGPFSKSVQSASKNPISPEM